MLASFYRLDLMRYYFVLLACSLVSCSSHPTTPNSDSDYKPSVTPLGSSNDRDQPLPTPNGAAPSPASSANAPRQTTAGNWPAAFTPGSLCARVAAHGATIRTRPAANGTRFGQLAKGERVQLAARTAGGWVGFNPGTAQAANAGIFRLRWVLAAEAFAPGDSCGQLPLVAVPPGGCLLMATHPVPVRDQPAAGAALLGTIPTGSYARVAQAPGATAKWVEILVPGHDVHGFVAADDASFTGSCQ